MRLNNSDLWEEYAKGKQTYLQLSLKYGRSIKTIQRRLDQHAINLVKPKNRAIIVLMDTTYWGRNFGLMLFKDAITKENLLRYLKTEGFTILAVVCDGRKGLIQSFRNIPVQMCQFHQSAIIRRLGYDRWMRNIAIGLGNAHYSPQITQALQQKQIDDESARDHIKWALNEQQIKRNSNGNLH